MKRFSERSATRILTRVRGGRHDSYARATLLILSTILGVWLVIVANTAAVEAQRYSAYGDSEKPVISYLLSDAGSAEEFQTAFGLTDEAMKGVLAAIREENEALASEYAESERIVESSGDLPNERVREKIAASDYGENVRAIVARTKAGLEELLPADRRNNLKTWVDAEWRQEVQAYNEESTDLYGVQSTSRGKVCEVYATQYIGYTRYEVALPHRKLKFDGGYRVRLRRGDHGVWAPVKEVGPWNTYDNYWQLSRYRTMWKDLPRCKPEAEAAYFNNYNHGEDEFGREVLNPAGVDLTPAVARGLGLAKYQNAWVRVRFPWVSR